MSSDATDAVLRSYREVPYDDLPVWETHPDALATAARMAGLTTAAVDRCRVLELGCAAAGNLVPMAEGLPHSRFVGVDLAPNQIAAGRALVERLGLSNVELLACSLTELPADLGQFDYILCHGVYSWVPDAVRARVLSVIRAHLLPAGVAYLSYNCYPGWHLKQALRGMMLLHTAPLTDGKRKVEQARAFVELVAATTPQPDSPYGRLIREKAEELSKHASSYIYHDYLETDNTPVYFHELMAEASREKLKYLGESRDTAPTLEELAPEAQRALGALRADPLRLEQYLDLVTGRAFRRTLLVRAEAPIERPLTDGKTPLAGLLVRGLARPVDAEPDLSATASVEFRSRHAHIATSDPIFKATLLALHRAGAPLSFAALLSAVRALLATTNATIDGEPMAPPVDEAALMPVVMRSARARLLSLHAHLEAVASVPLERPRAQPSARLCAERRAPVANLRHELVALDGLDLLLLPLLDGTRDRAALAASMAERLAQAGMAPAENGAPIDDEARVRELVAVSVEESLRNLCLNEVLTP